MLRSYGAMMVLVTASWLVGVPAVQADTAPGMAKQDAATQSREIPRSSRLRFRSGPTCLCSDGLGEAEIEAAERKRLDTIIGPRDAERR